MVLAGDNFVGTIVSADISTTTTLTYSFDHCSTTRNLFLSFRLNKMNEIHQQALEFSQDKADICL